MFELFFSALKALLDFVASLIASAFSILWAPLAALISAVWSQAQPYWDLSSSAALPYLNAAEQWAPVTYILYLMGASVALSAAFAVYKAVMKVIPHFGG